MNGLVFEFNTDHDELNPLKVVIINNEIHLWESIDNMSLEEIIERDIKYKLEIHPLDYDLSQHVTKIFRLEHMYCNKISGRMLPEDLDSFEQFRKLYLLRKELKDKFDGVRDWKCSDYETQIRKDFLLGFLEELIDKYC